MKVVALVPAYNEAHNLPWILPRLKRETCLSDVVVVASGCTDDTEAIARRHGVTVLTQFKREGKASAINLFLRSVPCDVVLMESADTIPGCGAIPAMLQRFHEARVGMVGGHPMPTDYPGTLLGQVSHIIWGAHHLTALDHPKLGEMVAWRNVLPQLALTSVDEAWIEAEIVGRGYRIEYEPRAVCFNKGPATVKDLLVQRVRIAKGHQAVAQHGYSVATAPWGRTLGYVWGATPRTVHGIAALGLLCIVEAYARTKTHSQPPTKGETPVWTTATSTKTVR